MMQKVHFRLTFVAQKRCCLSSLRRRRNLISVSNVCETAPISLFWAPKGLNELPEVRYEFPFILIGKATMRFLKGQSPCEVKSWYTDGVKNKDFGAVSKTDLKRV